MTGAEYPTLLLTPTRFLSPTEFCRRFELAIPLIKARYPEDAQAIDRVRFLINKSCLLDRLIYCGEKGPSQTPCPVHQGRWSGIQFNVIPADIENGCRCYQHNCGCTTGWQPDTACGCVDA